MHTHIEWNGDPSTHRLFATNEQAIHLLSVRVARGGSAALYHGAASRAKGSVCNCPRAPAECTSCPQGGASSGGVEQTRHAGHPTHLHVTPASAPATAHPLLRLQARSHSTACRAMLNSNKAYDTYGSAAPVEPQHVTPHYASIAPPSKPAAAKTKGTAGIAALAPLASSNNSLTHTHTPQGTMTGTTRSRTPWSKQLHPRCSSPYAVTE